MWQCGALMCEQIGCVSPACVSPPRISMTHSFSKSRHEVSESRRNCCATGNCYLHSAASRIPITPPTFCLRNSSSRCCSGCCRPSLGLRRRPGPAMHSASPSHASQHLVEAQACQVFADRIRPSPSACVLTRPANRLQLLHTNRCRVELDSVHVCT